MTFSCLPTVRENWGRRKHCAAVCTSLVSCSPWKGVFLAPLGFGRVWSSSYIFTRPYWHWIKNIYWKCEVFSLNSRFCTFHWARPRTMTTCPWHTVLAQQMHGWQQERTLSHSHLTHDLATTCLCHGQPGKAKEEGGNQFSAHERSEKPWSLARLCFHTFLHKDEVEKVLSLQCYVRFPCIAWLSELFKRKTAKPNVFSIQNTQPDEAASKDATSLCIWGRSICHSATCSCP